MKLNRRQQAVVVNFRLTYVYRLSDDGSSNSESKRQKQFNDDNQADRPKRTASSILKKE